ncbi:hypothetical protein C450_05195 [Halococcus salifodinae DSM 8989]|uniref:Uncharacterized protein n=1 Tax=Halococcus salifodinae DSM 8989 TaxID=1227456 RepID=M0NAR6_9EURY|nr:hypothetical protein C450_05195 [Halococcus salifodinae DSM 8989]
MEVLTSGRGTVGVFALVSMVGDPTVELVVKPSNRLGKSCFSLCFLRDSFGVLSLFCIDIGRFGGIGFLLPIPMIKITGWSIFLIPSIGSVVLEDARRRFDARLTVAIFSGRVLTTQGIASGVVARIAHRFASLRLCIG